MELVRKYSFPLSSFEGLPVSLTELPRSIWRLKFTAPSEKRRKTPQFILNCVHTVVPFPKMCGMRLCWKIYCFGVKWQLQHCVSKTHCWLAVVYGL